MVGVEGRRAEQDREALETFLVGNRDLERLKAFLDRFNVFEATGVVRQKLRHSGSLVFLMDPRGGYGLGEAFVRRLLQRVLENAGEVTVSLLGSREMVASMRDGSVVADIAIDQGGCFETGRPTTHSEPTYVEERVVHHCMANTPGAVARTSTLALTGVTLPYLIKIADGGTEGAAKADPTPAKSLPTLGGELLHGPVAGAHGLPYTDLQQLPT